MSPDRRARKRRRRSPRAHRLEFLAYLGFSALLGLVPRRLQPRAACLLARLWFHALPLRRGLVLENLARAFPDSDPAWRRRQARACCAHFVRMMGFEAREIERGRTDLALARLGPMHLPPGLSRERVFAEPGIFVTGHIGNWEMALAALARGHCRRPLGLAKPLHNPLLEARVARGREALGPRILSTNDRNLWREVLRHVRRGGALGIVADQDARRSGIFVPFFARPASTPRGPALFAVRLGLPLYVANCLRHPDDGRYHIHFHPPLVPNPDAPHEAEIARLTAAFTRQIEDDARARPDQYFWFHRRWKTRPRPNQV